MVVAEGGCRDRGDMVFFFLLLFFLVMLVVVVRDGGGGEEVERGYGRVKAYRGSTSWDSSDS